MLNGERIFLNRGLGACARHTDLSVLLFVSYSYLEQQASAPSPPPPHRPPTATTADACHGGDHLNARFLVLPRRPSIAFFLLLSRVGVGRVIQARGYSERVNHRQNL
jgi:hypothetical protein